MNIRNIGQVRDWFDVLQTTKRTQTAVMTLKPVNRQAANPRVTRRAIKFCLCWKGKLKAASMARRLACAKGDVIVIPAGTKHRFENRSSANAITFSTYSPPEY